MGRMVRRTVRRPVVTRATRHGKGTIRLSTVTGFLFGHKAFPRAVARAHGAWWADTRRRG